MKTILVVEDDKNLLDVTKMLLEKSGFRVYCAKDGREGLQIFLSQKNEINVIISDIVMPYMNGIELYKEIRKLDPKIDIILVTGYDLTGEGIDLEYEENMDILEKPVNFERIIDRINRNYS